MSDDQADGINIFTLAFSNDNVPNVTPFKTQVDADDSFTFPIQGQDIKTLVGPRRQAADLEGLLYVPTLPENDPCNKTAAGYIPKNVTTEFDVPQGKNSYFLFVAVVPWINSTCSVSYFNAVSQIPDTVAILTYIANDVSPSNFPAAAPPDPNDPMWNMNGSLSWKGNWEMTAVYAINADNANVIVNQLGLYSGNLTQAPEATVLGSMFDPRSFVRLYCDINAGSQSTLPSLWVFLLIVLGVLLAMIGLTSLCMHLVQRQRRTHIRNRVIAGELDLETLGIKRLKVPKELLDKVPLIVYVAPEDSLTQPKKSSATTPRAEASPNSSSEKDNDQIAPSQQQGEQSPASSIDIAKASADADVVEQQDLPPVSSLPHQHLDFAQPSCSICLDDFVSHQTILRVLSCKHVFHPACIDPVLREYSSLCPVCKASVLPAGYCPKITNAMVRRIRGLQRMRELEAWRHGQEPPVVTVHGRAATFGRQIRGRMNWRARANRDVELAQVGQSNAAAPSTTEGNPAGATPAAQTTTAMSAPMTADASQARPANVSREEWARRRAENMLSEPVPVEVANRQQETGRPRWRRALGPIFPVLA